MRWGGWGGRSRQYSKILLKISTLGDEAGFKDRYDLVEKLCLKLFVLQSHSMMQLICNILMGAFVAPCLWCADQGDWLTNQYDQYTHIIIAGYITSNSRPQVVHWTALDIANWTCICNFASLYNGLNFTQHWNALHVFAVLHTALQSVLYCTNIHYIAHSVAVGCI